MSTYNKRNLDIGKVASKNSIKPELASIAFWGDRTIATDSFRLIEMSAPGKRLKEPELIPAEVLKKNFKIGPNDELTLDEIKTRGAVDSIEADYPEVDQVIDRIFSREDDVKITVNGQYLAELADQLRRLSKINKVTLSFSTKKNEAITFTAEDMKTGQKARALLMPMNR